LFNIVKHRWVSANITHKHTQIRVPLWKLDAFLAQLAIDFLEPRELILLHHKCVGPDLD
jgi:hypothetical protein